MSTTLSLSSDHASCLLYHSESDFDPPICSLQAFHYVLPPRSRLSPLLDVIFDIACHFLENTKPFTPSSATDASLDSNITCLFEIFLGFCTLSLNVSFSLQHQTDFACLVLALTALVEAVARRPVPRVFQFTGVTQVCKRCSSGH
jgi:hypothetical protein